MSKFKKPNWYPEDDIEAKKQGWVYIKNHDEVLCAIPHLDARIAAESDEEDVDDDIDDEDDNNDNPPE